MAATKYQVLYRYINEATNTPITNSMDNEYVQVCEFYVDPYHKIFSNDAKVQAEATDEQQEMISFGNAYFVLMLIGMVFTCLLGHVNNC